MEQLLKNRYRVLKQIAETAVSLTFRGENITNSEPVLIKVYRRNLFDNALIEKFYQIFEKPRVFRHENVATFKDADYGWKGFYFIREWIKGKSLAEKLKEDHLIEPERASFIAASLAETLSAAKEKGLIHGNLKPQNIFLNQDGKIKITDFGLDFAMRHKKDYQILKVMEDSFYLSPEEIYGGQSSSSSDIYSLGIVLYEMLTGKRPAQEADLSLKSSLNSLTQSFTPPFKINAKIPPYLSEITLKCLEKDPLLRFDSGKVIKKSLSEKVVFNKSYDIKLNSFKFEADPTSSPISKEKEIYKSHKITYDLTHQPKKPNFLKWVMILTLTLVTGSLFWFMLNLILGRN